MTPGPVSKFSFSCLGYFGRKESLPIKFVDLFGHQSQLKAKASEVSRLPIFDK